MGLILSVVALGASASLSPATLAVFIGVLGTSRARVNAAAFLTGWLASAAVVFTASYFLGSAPAIRHGIPRTIVLVLEVLLGCFLVVLGWRRWRDRASGSSATGGLAPPALSERIGDMGPGTAAILGVLKEPWTITAAAAAVVVHHHAAPLVTFLAFLAFALSATASVGVMYLYFAREPDQAEARLSLLRHRVAAGGPAIFAVAAIAVGAFLAVDGLVGLLSA
jgi:hypothetical protein